MPADLQYVTPPARRQLPDSNAVQGGAVPHDSSDAQQPTGGRTNGAEGAQTAMQKHSKQLDQKLEAREQETMSRMQASYTEYNATVLCPSIDSLP